MPSISFAVNIVATSYEINYVPHKNLVQVIAHYGTCDWKEIGRMQLSEFLNKLGVTRKECHDALTELPVTEGTAFV